MDFSLVSPPRDEADFVRFIGAWIWCAAAINGLAVLTVLLPFWSWWVERGVSGVVPGKDASAKPGRLQYQLLAVAILVAFHAGLPRLSHSLWGDELIAFRQSVGGQFTRDVETDGIEAALDRIYWSEAGWKDALWHYETTNPHFLYNLAGKFSLTLQQSADAKGPWLVREPALRFFPFIAGLGAIGAWFVLAARAGAGSVAGWFCLALSVHPWFIRYITEARGYAFVLLLLPLFVLSLDRALRDSSWFRWSLHGLTGGLLLYSWPGMVLPWLLVNGVAAIRCRAGGEPTIARFRARRLVLTNLFLGMLLLMLVAPCFAQLGPYLREDAARLPMGLPWLKDLAARFLLGIDWIEHGSATPDPARSPTLTSLRQSPVHLLLLATTGAAALAGLLAGIPWIARNRSAPWRLMAGVAASSLLLYVPAALAGIYLFHWYFVFLLPPFLLVAAVGLGALARSRKQASVPVALALVSFGILAFSASSKLRARSADPRRESVLATRGTLDPLGSGNHRILTAHVGTTALGYDPLGFYLEETPEPDAPSLPALMRLADVLGRELLVNVGYPSNARAEAPTVMRIIDKSGYFERTTRFSGLEPQFEREIYRYTGGMFGSLRGRPVE